ALLAADGESERHPFGRVRSHPVGVEDAVNAAPVAGARVDQADTENALGGGVEEKETTRRVGDDEAIAHAVEDGLKELKLSGGRLGLGRWGRGRARSRMVGARSVLLPFWAGRSVGHTHPLWVVRVGVVCRLRLCKAASGKPPPPSPPKEFKGG